MTTQNKTQEHTSRDCPIVVYTDRLWSDIPRQDNPAYHYKHDDYGERESEAILISRAVEYRINGQGEYVVTYIPLQGVFVHRGSFLELSDALLFAKALSERKHDQD